MKILKPLFRCLGLLWLAVVSVLSAQAANPFVHQLFTSNMVLQRDAADPIWGWTTAGNTVTVTVRDQNSAIVQTQSATADSNGRWQTSVGPFSAQPGHPAYTITVAASGQTSTTFTGVLFGDVYLCSGQSNMDFTLNGTPVYNLANEIADSANYPMIRQFYVAHTSVRNPQVTIPSASWSVAGPTTTGAFSATGYFMAREIYKQQGVPVGILCSAWAGTEIKLWLPNEYTSSFPDFTQALFDRSSTDNNISGAYNGMIAPIAPFKFRAVTWYQGEFNYTLPEQYKRLLPALLSSWRSLFGDPNLPFLVVQIPMNNSYKDLREAQRMTVKDDANSRLVVTMETGEGTVLHPQDKQDAGLRAAWAAADLVYGQTNVAQSPMFDYATVSGSTMRCYFTNAGEGLMVGLKTIQKSGTQTPVQQLVSGTLVGFKVAGSDKTFSNANAVIDDATNTVVVTSPSVPSPMYVRYAYDSSAGANLYAKIKDSNGNVVDGNPASSFRSDPIYTLKVNNGSGSGTYNLGGQTTISGSTFAGQTFDHWEGDASALSGTASNSVTASIAQNYTTVFAAYRITGAPSNFNVTRGAGQLTLNWNAMTGAHYHLKRSTVSGGPYTTIASDLNGTTTYVDSGLTQGVSYYYVVSAQGILGEGPNSSEISAQTLPVVENLKTTTGPAQVGLTWTPPAGAVHSYSVKRSTTSGGPYETIVSDLSALNYTDQRVLNGETYYYIVTAFNGAQESPNCPEVRGIPTFLPPPFQDTDIGPVGISGGAYTSAPGTYTLAYSGTTIGDASGNDTFNFAYYAPVSGTFTFTARVASFSNGASNPEVGIMARRVLSGSSGYVRTYVTSTQTCYQGRSGTTGGPGTSASTSTNRWIRITRDSNSYYRGYVSPDGITWTQQGTPVSVSGSVYIGFFGVAKNNSVMNVSSFDNVTFTPAWTLQAPAVPTGLNASLSGSTSAVLTWNAAAGATGYNVKRSSTSGGPYTSLASGTNTVRYTATGLSSGTTSYFVVSGTSSEGEGANSSQFVVDMEAPVINPISDIVAVATGSTGAVVNFSPAANDDVEGALQPVCTPASGSLFPIGTTTVSVQASDAAGNVSSRTFNVTVNLPAPTGLSAILLSDSQVRLDWTNNAPYASGYLVQRSLRGMNNWATLTSSLAPGANTYQDNTLSAGTEYDYRIQCMGSGGVSSFVPVSATTPADIGDGIPGWWRYLHFGNGVSVTEDSAASADPDGDGASNLREYLASTIPTDSKSLLRTTQLARSGSNLVIQFTSATGKTYRLERSVNLGASATWNPVQDNIPGTGALISGTDTGAGSQSRGFYRVLVK